MISENLRAFRNVVWPWKLLSFLVVLILLAASASIGGDVTGDASAFYMALPKMIGAAHELILMPGYQSFISIGIPSEMQLAVLFLLGMPGASARLFCWVTGMACVLALSLLGREAGVGKRGVIISLAMMGTSSAVALLWGQGKTDLFAATLGIAAALYALKSWKEEDKTRNIILAGLFTGFALIAKLSYVVAFLPSMYILLFWPQFPKIWHAFTHRSAVWQTLRQHLFQGLIFGLAFLPAFVPHFIKNYILFGLFVNTLGSNVYFTAATTKYIVSIYPLLLVYGNFWGQFGNMSPLFLLFLPLIFFLPKSPKAASAPLTAIFFAAFAGLCAWIVIFPAVPMPRYFMATLLLLALPAGWIAERLASNGKTMLYAVTSISAITIAMFFQHWRVDIYPMKQAFDYLFLTQSEQALKKTEFDSYIVYDAINKVAPPGARVFLFSYFRFWLRPDLIQCVDNDNGQLLGEKNISSNAFWEKFYQQDFTYIYVDNIAKTEEIEKSTPSWVTLERISASGTSGSAFHVVFKDPPVQVQITTVEVAPGHWKIKNLPNTPKK